MRSKTPPPINPKDLIAGLGKGLRVIEAFDDDHSRLTASQAAELADLTRTAARRHLLSLVHFEYAATDGKHFWLLPRVLRLGQSYLGAARLPRLVQPFIQRIAQQCGETVNVSVLDGHEVVYVARSNPPRWMSIGYQVGMRVPAHVVTPGVVILATRREVEVRKWIAEHHFAAFTGQTVTEPADFAKEVQTARQQDYWATSGQLDAAFSGISVPLVDRKGQCAGAMGMTVLASNYSLQDMQAKLLPHLLDTAQVLRPLL
jgi:IclR family transcriptional regulator, pca regulon regulatory protein